MGALQKIKLVKELKSLYENLQKEEKALKKIKITKEMKRVYLLINPNVDELNREVHVRSSLDKVKQTLSKKEIKITDLDGIIANVELIDNNLHIASSSDIKEIEGLYKGHILRLSPNATLDGVQGLFKDKVRQDSVQIIPLEDLKNLKSSSPTEKQKESGNYKKHKIKLQKRLITIENIAGSIRSNIDSDGKRWSTKMKDHYGYFNGTLGADGDEIDVFVNSEATTQEIESRKAFTILQNDIITHKFDEFKVVLGATSRSHAKEIYLRNYDDDFKGFGSVEKCEPNLDEWLNENSEELA